MKEGYENNPICPCIFFKKSKTRFTIITMYVDDLNFVVIPEELTKTTKYLKKEFEMKDLEKTKLSQTTNRAFHYWSVGSPMNIH